MAIIINYSIIYTLIVLCISKRVGAQDPASGYPDLNSACTLPVGNVCTTQQWGCTGGKCNMSL